MIKVITYGTFDLFHEGHYRLLQRAKALGDYLIVGVTTEAYDVTRGKFNVIDNLMTRIENVRKTGFADEIIIEESSGQKFSDIKKYDIDIFTVGSDWIGTGRIADRFVPEARQVSGVSTQGVYNPNTESALRFAGRWGIEAYQSLEDFYSAIDVVYIASPHETHYGYIKTSLEHGKHVLCEKPMVLKRAQAEEAFQMARERDLILMEEVKTAYCPGFNKLLGIACSGSIGSIRNVEACFTKLEKPHARELTDQAFGGSFTELGSYVMLPILKIFGTEYKELRFDSVTGENGLDLFTKASFVYPAGMASATCGLGVKSDGRLLIAGTKGYIIAEAPWWKTTYFEVHYEEASRVDRYSELFMGDGLRYEISNFLYMINKSDKDNFKLTRSESVAMAEIMETFMERAGRGM